MLKGVDMSLYMILQRHFSVYLTPITISAVIGKWTDERRWDDDSETEYESDGNGKIIDKWDENDDKTAWNASLGGEDWWNDQNYPKELERVIQYGSKYVVLYNNKKEALTNAKRVNCGHEYYGNVGTYDIRNHYHAYCIVLTKTL